MSDTEDEVEDDEEDDEGDEEELERFEALCASFRRNDPETTEVPRFYLTNAYGRRLGEALQGNQHVSYMCINLDHLLDGNEEGTDSIALLLRYFRESEAMRKVELWGNAGRLTAEAGKTIILAIAENPCIEDLNMSINVEHVLEEFAFFLRRTQSLKTLRITLDGEATSSQTRELLAEAFGANQTLETLTLQNGSNTDLVESVLRRLGSHPCLRELQLICLTNVRVADIHALASLLRSTTLLVHLKLRSYIFNKEQMEVLVEGLHSNQSLTKLSVSGCSFNLEASDVFRCFVQTCETRSSIRELSFDGTFGLGAQFTGVLLGYWLILLDENQGAGSSIASSLQILDLGSNLAGFFLALEDNASRILLPCLHCRDHMGRADWDALNRCLPKLVYLKELYIAGLEGGDVSSRGFLDALRKNGSLQHVVITQANFFNEAEACLVQSYCKRNEAIPSLVAKVQLDKDGDDDETDILLFPTIFQLAKQATRTAPNSILVGLLAAGDAIGPCRQCDKRSRPDEMVERFS